MLRKLGFPTLALAAAMAVAVPTLTLAADRDDHRGRDNDRHEVYRGHDRDDRRWDRDGDRDRDREVRWAAPVPVVHGYYDRYGVWHAYGY